MPALPQRVFCEWLGTAFLLAAVVGSGIMAQKVAGGNGALALLCNTLPTGAILVVLILTFGPLSGAHPRRDPCLRPACRSAVVDGDGLYRRASAGRSSCFRCPSRLSAASG